MDNIDPLTGLPLTGAEANVPVPVGETAESNVASLKDVLGGALKKEFPSDEAALKAVVDTFSFVGRKQTEMQNTSNDSSSAPVTKAEFENLARSIRTDQFYIAHPEFKDYRDLISSMGSEPEEVVKNEVFKKAYNALAAQNQNQEESAPLRSNPRINIPANSDYSQDLERARATGDWIAFMEKYKGLAQPQ